MIWDRENSEWLLDMPSNRYRVEHGSRLSGTSDFDWEDDSIGHSSHESVDYRSRGYAIKKAKTLLSRSDVSYSRVVEIESKKISNLGNDIIIEWDLLEADPIWN